MLKSIKAGLVIAGVIAGLHLASAINGYNSTKGRIDTVIAGEKTYEKISDSEEADTSPSSVSVDERIYRARRENIDSWGMMSLGYNRKTEFEISDTQEWNYILPDRKIELINYLDIKSDYLHFEFVGENSNKEFVRVRAFVRADICVGSLAEQIYLAKRLGNQPPRYFVISEEEHKENSMLITYKDVESIEEIMLIKKLCSEFE